MTFAAAGQHAFDDCGTVVDGGAVTGGGDQCMVLFIRPHGTTSNGESQQHNSSCLLYFLVKNVMQPAREDIML